MVPADVITVKVTCSPSCVLDYYLMDGKRHDGANQHTQTDESPLQTTIKSTAVEGRSKQVSSPEQNNHIR